MASFFVRPLAISRTGDDSPASSLLRYVWRMSGRHQIWICVLALMVALVNLAPLELQRRLIDDAVRTADVTMLIWLAAIYLAVLVVHGGAKFVLRMYQGWLSESAIRYNREHLAEIHECRGEADQSGSEGRVVSVVAAEVDKLGGFVGEGLSQPVVNISMLLAIAGYMLLVEPLVALYSLLFLVPQIVAVPYVQKFINALVEERVSLLRQLSDDLVGLPHDGADLKESGVLEKLDGTYVNRMKVYLLKFGLKAVVNLLNALAPLTVLAVGGYFVIAGETTIGVVVAFTSGFDRLANPLRELIAYYRLAAQAQVQHRMIAEWMT